MEQLISREIFTKVANHLLEKEVTVITGARQTGKTTLLFQLREWLINEKKVEKNQIEFFNLDLINDIQGIKDQNDIIRFIKEKLNQIKFLYIFIDEIQRLDSPGKYLKGIYDLNLPIKLVVTGSSSLEIKSKIFESLAGRKRVFHIWPFSFYEYLSCNAPELKDLLTAKDISPLNERKISDHFLNFVVFGGYPRVVLTPDAEEKIHLLNEIYSSYVEKDIVGLTKIKNPFVFLKLVTLLADQVGNLINHQEISNTLGMNFRTVESYLHLLESTFVVENIRPYYSNARKELTKMPKIFFVDNGLRNLAIKYFAEFSNNRDKGKLLENYVLSFLKKSWEGTINFWRTKDKNEVDFILRDYYGNIIPIEVKAMQLQKPLVNKGLNIFIEKYAPNKAIVVNLSLEKKLKVNNTTTVEFVLPYRLKKMLI